MDADETSNASLIVPALMLAALVYAMWYICCASQNKGLQRETPHSYSSTQAAMNTRED